MTWIDIVGFGIPACYAVVFFGAVTGVIAGRTTQDKLLLSSGGWVFFPCGSHYLSYAIYHDLATVSQAEKSVLLVVFAVAIVTAALVNPITLQKAAGRIAERDRKLTEREEAIAERDRRIEQFSWLLKNIGACIVFLQYVDVNKSTVVDLSDSMLDWLAERDICPIGLVKKGANWWDLMGNGGEVPQRWKRQSQKCVEGLTQYGCKTEHWDEHNLWFSWRIRLNSIDDRTYVIELFDVTEYMTSITTLEAENERLELLSEALANKSLDDIANLVNKKKGASE